MVTIQQGHQNFDLIGKLTILLHLNSNFCTFFDDKVFVQLENKLFYLIPSKLSNEGAVDGLITAYMIICFT